MIADKHAINRVRATSLVLRLAALVLVPSLALSKRTAPATVTPVVHEGVRYVAPNDDGRRGYIEARDAHTNEKIWELTVFANPIDPNLEEDVQWVFIESLSIHDDTLIVASERKNTYGIDLKTKAITQLPPAPSQTATPQPRNIPELVQRAVTNGSLAKGYDVSFHLIPSYLQGDFNGDGNIDVAVLVKQRATEKLGLRSSMAGWARQRFSAQGQQSVMVAMTSRGWILGKFILRTVPPMPQVKPASYVFAATHFW